MKELDDITIKSAAKGTLHAFRKVYDYYNLFVWKVIYRAVNGDEDAAKHIMQDVFIKVHNVLKTFKFQSAFSTWLYRITYNETMAYLKKQKIDAQRVVTYDDTITRDTKEISYEHKDTVSALLHTLSPQERFILVAREVHDVPFEELADITGKSSGALRTMVHRIKENLRKEFDYETGRILSEAV